MAQLRKDALATAANVIKNETTPSANTATRIGQHMLDQKDSLLGSIVLNVSELSALRGLSLLDLTTAYILSDAEDGSRVLELRAQAIDGNLFHATDLLTGDIGTYSLSADLLTKANIKWLVYTVDQEAVLDSFIIVVANSIITDPDPIEGRGYKVFVRNGFATIDGVPYAQGLEIIRIYHSGSWKSYIQGEVSFSVSFTKTEIRASNIFKDITTMPEPPAGYAWLFTNAFYSLSGATTPYDGAPNVFVGVETAARGQYTDRNSATQILNTGVSSTGGLIERFIFSGTDTVIPQKKGRVGVMGGVSTVGDGTLTVYGTAKLITI
jgi:hypothetical protein